MNIALSARAAVHLSKSDELAPACGVRTTGSTFVVTTKDVTCFRCVRLIEAREEAVDRIAYGAGLVDQQDMDYSQAEIPASTPERCCEHALMYHGAQGCDTCRCNTPRNVMPQAGEVTVGRNVETENGRIPFTAQLVEAVNLSWIPATSPGAVITATNPGDKVWVYVQIEGCKARMLYTGHSLVEAGKARDAYVVKHTDHVATMAKDLSGGSVSLSPVPVYKTTYGRTSVSNTPVHETDARTGLPVVTINGKRFVIGAQQADGYEDFVEFWNACPGNFCQGVIFRASGSSYLGTTNRMIWDAHRRIRNV